MNPTGTVAARVLALCPLVAALLLLMMACSSESASRAREQDLPAARSAGIDGGPTAKGSNPTPSALGSSGGGPSPPGGPGEASEQLPGAPPFEVELTAKLRSAWASRSPQYKPRTHHLWPDGSPKYTNRLFLETSPYLLQHAHNPVNWYPWGDEAFETARKLGRPVLLSVGYSTCHWCHVMEEESFEDEEIARVMNESYIAIKVDREERPDVDAIYMNAVQMLTGRGGWPMTVWLTPDRKPYFGGTYFPARDGDRGVHMGFLTLLRRLRQAYDEEPARVAESASQVSEAIRKNLTPDRAGDTLPDPRILHDAFRHYRERFDPANGGLAGAPKFPSGLPVRLLLRYYRRTGNEESLEMAALTLERMAAGGIHDHVGGGFHRYSTDERWLVPHFEKMLYDNALLATVYLEGYQATRRDDFARVARDILDYVGRELTAPGGGFYSATDADSPTPSGGREEGWFFTWTPAEIRAAVGGEQARIVEAYYGVTAEGNFEGRSIPHESKPFEQVASELRLSQEKARSALGKARDLLYAVRARRQPPHRDEKILAAWNGLMISGFARGALALGEPRYARRAEEAAEFVLSRMQKNGRLLRSYKDGEARHDAYLDDYAFFIAGLLDLHEATGNPQWIKEAIALDAVLEKLYEDEEAGGFFMVSHDHEELLAREKPAYDGAEPSGNSVQALNLLRLFEFTTVDRYRVRAERTLRFFASGLSHAPASMSEMFLAVDFHLDLPLEIVIVAPSSTGDAEPFLAQLRSAFVPNRILTLAVEGPSLKRHAELVPLVEGKVTRDGKATAYVCEVGVCRLPTTDPEVFAEQIRKVNRLESP